MAALIIYTRFITMRGNASHGTADSVLNFKPLDGLLVEPLDLSSVCIYPFLISLRALCAAAALLKLKCLVKQGLMERKT